MIAIKGMKMPKSCSECSFKANDYVCGLLDCAFSCNHFTERNYNCPLVEIVTCEDCKHRNRNYEKDGFGYCRKVKQDTHEIFFCRYGERREQMAEVIKVEDCGENIGDYDIQIHNAIIIPRGATNGDIIKAMTGEKFSIGNESHDLMISNGEHFFAFDVDWWNAPYRLEGRK